MTEDPLGAAVDGAARRSARASILFVHGGDDFAREVFRHERRGYWSAALPLVLEKYGLLSLRSAPAEEALSDPSIWHDHDLVLLGRLPDHAWDEEGVARALGGRAGIVMEGPLPAPLARALGIVARPAGSEGSVAAVDQAIHAGALRWGHPPGGTVSEPSRRTMVHKDELDWTAIPGVSLTADQAAAWRARGWDAERWRAHPELETIATWDAPGGDGTWPALARHGRIVVCSFGLFSFLGQVHSAEPTDGNEYVTWPRSTGLESMLLAVLDDLYARVEAPRPRLLPWPRGMEWGLNVRHDFDRSMPPSRVADVLERHAHAGTRGTWYWRARHLAPDDSPQAPSAPNAAGASITRNSDGDQALGQVADAPHQEVALHTEAVWAGGERELRAIERVTGRSVLGTSAHGSADCFRWQGAPNVLWAERQRLAYTELLGRSSFHLHRYPALEADGSIVPSEVLCLPHHASFDRSVKTGDIAPDDVVRTAKVFRKAGGWLQVLNHPDINVPEFFDTLAALPRQRRFDWTARQVADWWRRTHVLGLLYIERLGGERFRVWAKEAVQDAVLELRLPNGATRQFPVDLEPGESVTVGGSDSPVGLGGVKPPAGETD